MKIILFALLLLTNATAYAATQLIYRNSNYALLRSDRAGKSDQCFIVSAKSPIKDGHTYLVVFPGSILLFAVEGTDYFQSAKTATLKVGDNKGIEIPMMGIFSAIVPLLDMMSGKHEKVTIDVEFDNRTDTHTFNTGGFSHAAIQQLACIADIAPLLSRKIHEVTIDPTLDEKP